MPHQAPYLAVADALRVRVLAGEWEIGRRLPSRARLAEEYGVGVLGRVLGSAFGAAATLWIGAAGMTLSFLPAFLSPLRALRTTRPSPATTG